MNENWDEDVRADMSDALDRIAPMEGQKGGIEGVRYRHDAEGRDDMPVRYSFGEERSENVWGVLM